MNMLMLLLAAQAVPVPAGRWIPLDHEARCTIFQADGVKQSLEATLTHLNRYRTSVSLTTSAKGLSTEKAASFGQAGPDGFAIKARAGGKEYTYAFAGILRSDAKVANGTLRVSVRNGSEPIRYVATGICDIQSKAAKI